MIILSITALKDTICRVQFDSGEFIDLPLDLIYKFALNKGKEVNDEQLGYIKYDLDLIEIKQKAIKFASYKNRTEKEVFQKLKSFDYPDEMIENTISFLIDFNYLDDKQYAISFIKDNLKLKAKSLGKIKSDLIIKGIDKYLLEDVFAEFTEQDDELENCKKMLNKKMNTTKAKDEKELVFKVSNYLLYKGFKRDIITRAFEELTLIILITLFSAISLFATPLDSCKIRMSEAINSYQPAIIPVMNFGGSTLYFDRKLHPENVNGLYDEDDIWYSNSNGLDWSEPQNFAKFNSNNSDVLFYITPDGTKALLYGEYKLPNSKMITNGFFILDKFNSSKTIIPCKIKNFTNLAKNFYATLSYDAKTMILAIETKNGVGELDLYVSLYDEKKDFWSEPKNLGKTINSTFSEGSPFLSYDLKTLYFTSTRDGGFGQNDIYATKRLDETWENWSVPENLGKSFNSQFDENSIWINATSDTAIVVSSDSITHRPGLYQMCIPDKFKPEPYNIIMFNSNVPFGTDYEINITQKNTKYRINDQYNALYFIINKDDFLEADINCKGFKRVTQKINYKPVEKPTIFTHNYILDKESSIKTELRDTIFFEFADFTWKLKDLETLELSIKLGLDSTKQYNCTLSGFTDTTGSIDDNSLLSKKRVETIKMALQKHKNININHLIYNGEDYANKNNPKFCRRVEIYIKEE
jgi:SOS response regulatory protein OraA/RecX/outer membrane protein OmpA-like peptidoglycan-associated protein